MTSLFSSSVIFLFFVFLVILVFLYILSIAWCVKDARARGGNTVLSLVLALIPFAGVLAHILIRPQLTLIDKQEQELDIALKQRQLRKYGNCAKCGAPVKEDYLACPSCGQKLKDVCVSCGKPIEFNWSTCPYCGKQIIKNVSTDNDSTFKHDSSVHKHSHSKSIERPSVSRSNTTTKDDK